MGINTLYTQIKDVYKYTCILENDGKKGGRQGIDGLCVVTQTNAWKTV